MKSDWKTNFSQIRRKVVIFSKKCRGVNFDVKCVWNENASWKCLFLFNVQASFAKKSKHSKFIENWKIWLRRSIFDKKVSVLLRSIFRKSLGRTCDGGSQRSCFFNPMIWYGGCWNFLVHWTQWNYISLTYVWAKLLFNSASLQLAEHIDR